MARRETLGSIRCVPRDQVRVVAVEVAKQQRSSTIRAYPNGMLRALALKDISLGYFWREANPRGTLTPGIPPACGPASPFACAPARAWASKRNVTRPPAGRRKARCIRGTLEEELRSGDIAKT